MFCESFGKWLKGQRKRDYNFYSFFKDSNFVVDNPKLKPDDVVEVSALGERFLEEHIVFQVFANTTEQKNNVKAYKAIAQVFRKMSEDCLGRAEVEKRLREPLSCVGEK